jgi:hypothetical protein
MLRSYAFLYFLTILCLPFTYAISLTYDGPFIFLIVDSFFLSFIVDSLMLRLTEHYCASLRNTALYCGLTYFLTNYAALLIYAYRSPYLLRTADRLSSI